MTLKCPKCQTKNPEDSKFCKECASPLPRLDELQISQTKTLETFKDRFPKGLLFADRYRIIEKLGYGGMGEVYRVKDEKLDEEMALKVLKPEIAAVEETIERFKNELKLARKISHRHICRMYDLNEEKENPFITMEYVEGIDLKNFIRKKERVPEKETVSIAIQICEGLVEAHRLGVIHRDLKPQNIMIDADGNIKIMDFGIARITTAPGMTQTGIMIGTPDYMSPEQAAGEEADHRSDIYSLGVVLYEMATGSLPFEGETALSVALKHQSHLPLNPKKLSPEISDDLSRLILVCLEKERKRRYQTAKELLDDLINIEKGFPIGAKIKPARKTFASTMIRSKFFSPVLVAFAIVIAVLGITVWRTLLHTPSDTIASDKPSIAVLDFRNNSSRSELNILRGFIAELLSSDLNQSNLIRLFPRNFVLEVFSQLDIIPATDLSADVIKKISERAGVNHILEGYFYVEADKLKVNINVTKTDPWEVLGGYEAECRLIEGEPEKISLLIDELTKKIKVIMGLSEDQIASDLDQTLANFMSPSLEATKKYFYGHEYLNQNDIPKSIQSLREAIEIDPEFAFAYGLLSNVYSYFPEHYEKMVENAKKAYKYKDRLPPKDRYLLEAYYYHKVDIDYARARSFYNQGLEIDPKDGVLNNMSGILYSDLEDWDEAANRFGTPIDMNNPQFFVYANQAMVYCRIKSFADAKNIITKYLSEYKDVPALRYFLTQTYLYQGDLGLATEELERALSLYPYPVFTPFIRLKGDLLFCRADFEGAEKEYRLLLESEMPSEKLWAYHRLGNLYLAQGRFKLAKEYIAQAIKAAQELKQEEYEVILHLILAHIELSAGNHESALTACQQAWELASGRKNTRLQIRILMLLGLAQLGMNRYADVEETASQIELLDQNGLFKKLMRCRLHLLGELERKKGNYSNAADYLIESMNLHSGQTYDWPDVTVINDQSMYSNAIARIYFESGELEKATTEYKNIISLLGCRITFGDIHARSFYMLGKIYEQQGDTAKAIEHYERFLDLWKDADPGIAEVEDAKKRLDGLKISK